MVTVKGSVEYVIHRSPDSGYTVLELSDEGGPITVVGIMPELSPGEVIQVEGDFVTHPQYGPQLRAEHVSFCRPEDERAMARYLASGAIKGIGPQLAARIISHFHNQSFQIMEEDPQALARVPGISLKGARKIQAQMLEKKELKDALIYMDGYGIPLPLATRIFERYGASLYRVLEENPYRLMDDITHVGFRIADEIARRTGLDPASETRIISGLLYSMGQALEEGHVFLPRTSLQSFAAELLGLPEEVIAHGIEELAYDKRFVLREVAGVPAVYLASFYFMELEAASRLTSLDGAFDLPESAVEQAVDHVKEQAELPLDETQLDAFRLAITRGVSVITGGPGTGKTTIISAILQYFEAQEFEVALAAPTGRAAKRITEATGRPAATIHRLLEYMGAPDDQNPGPENLRFTRNEQNPLEADAVIVDEVSMVDLPLLYALLRALTPGTRLILVGDADQLPSVGPGNVLKDIIRSGVITTTALSRIYRQSEGSDIVENAHRIRRGEYIDPTRKSRDFLFVRRSYPKDVRDAVVKLALESLPSYVNTAPGDIQVIAPSRKGPLGVEALNKILQDALNPPSSRKREKNFPKGLFREGDKLMQIKNNYQKEWAYTKLPGQGGSGIFNGDIGILEEIRFFSEELVILFDDERRAIYDFNEADELEPAYAITVHKAQGSEYPAVILPLLNVPQLLMTRPLIYTAVTRARRCVTVVGNPAVFQQMVDQEGEQRRYSSLHLNLIDLAQRP